jgi:TonB-dependent SusC/RagA subfamily outer membrane receptor
MKKTDKLKYYVVIVLVFSSILAFAQQGVVTGRVTSQEDQGGLPGVNVIIKGTSQGSVTDVEGNYTIEVPGPEAVLVFSSVGYVTEEVIVGSQSVIDRMMVADVTSLDELVVVGYGSQLKKEVTGAVQTVEMENLKDLPLSQITQKMQGQMAGVAVKQTTGKPGEGMNVRIRGQFSISAGSEPLYVIDGFPITGGINKINPDEIEDITVLKDAASTSLYGSRAANGVVLITTKKGKAGQTNVSFNASYGIQEVPQRGRIDMMDAVEFAQFKKEFYEDAGQPVPEMFQDPSQYEGKKQ